MSQKQKGMPAFIPNSLGGQDEVYLPIVGTVDFLDAILVFGPSVFILSAGDSLPLFLDDFALVTSIVAALLGTSLLFIKPSYLSVNEWISAYRGFRGRKKQLTKNIQTESGDAVTTVDLYPGDDTRQLTNLKQLHPHRNAVELNDGTIIGILRFTGSNLDMATRQQQIQVVDAYSQAVSSELSDRIQFYFPMRNISLEETIEVYESQDPKGGNGFLDAYVEDRADWLTNVSQDSYVRETYAIVPVDASDVVTSSTAGTTGGGLGNLPFGQVFEDLARVLNGGSGIQSNRELRQKQFRELETRTNSIGNSLSKGPGNQAVRVSGAKSVALFKEFWEGVEIFDDEIDGLARQQPVVIGNDDQSGDNS